MGKQRRVSASYDDEFDNLVAKLRDDKEFANKYISEKGVKLENHFVQENFSNSKNNDYLDGNEDPHNFRGGLNLNNEDPFNDLRADRQSALDHLGIGAIRTVAKAATEIAKLPGVIGGIAMSPFAEENEGFETAFNNQWIKFFDGLNEDVKETMPVYVKESVKNGDFFTKIGSSATWATEGADGAGYMLGALAPGGLFKYFGGAGKLFGASIKAAKLAKYGKGMEAGRKAINAAGITINNIDQFMIPAFNTIAEAGAESKGVWDGMESRKGKAHTEYMSKLNPNDPRFRQAIILKNEQLDQLRRSGEISIDEYNQQSANVYNTVIDEMFEKDFKEQKALAAQNTFFKNVAVLAGPNYIQAKMLFGKTPSKVLLDKIGGLSEKSIKNTVKQGVKNFAKGFASEGAEEVGQTAVEHRNIEQGLKFKLGDDRGNDYNVLTFGDDFIKTLGTTEGQMAGFLGGIMGAPMSAVGGYKQDISDRISTERLREKINGASTAYADIKNTNIYEQEEYTNPETGEIDFRDKEVDGKKVFIPENVAKVKNALNLIEKDSNEYDNAVEDGDVEKIEEFRNRGEFNVIANFIGEDEVTLDALHEHLKVAFPTETSKDISDEQVKINKTNLERIDKIMSKAKHLQKDFVSFKDMSASILRINHPGITENSTKEEKKVANEHLEDFLNRVGNTFLSERAEEYEAKQVLNKLEKQKLELENNSSIIEIDNPNYIEGVSSEFDKKTKTRSNNPRLELVNSLIDTVKEKLKGYEENTNSNIWNNELLNKQFAEEVEERKQIKEDNSPEQVAKNDEVITAVKSSTTVEEVADIEKNAPKEVIANPVIKNQIDKVKEALAEAKRRKDAEEIAGATQEDNDFNDTTGYSDLNGTEGSNITDELIPQQAENNTSEELKDIKTEEESAGKGAQVISTYRNDDKKGRWKSGDIIPFMKEQFSNFLKYEKEPINKSGKPVTFEINNNPGPNENVNKALILYNELLKKGFTNMTTDEYTLLYEYLPINVRFTSQVNAPIETKRVATFDEETGKWVEKMNISTGLLRTELISNLRKGVSFENMSTTIQDQYKGLLKIDDNRFANNNILQLDGVKDLNYIRENLYVINSFGKLQNILNDKIFEFNNDKVKPNAAGEIYLTIPQANGKLFPLKLNIKKISESEAVLLYEIYKEIITNEKSLDTTVSEVNDDLKEAILTNFEAELNIIGGNKNDIKLQEIIDLLIYQSANIKSQMQVVNGILYYGDKESTIDTIEQNQNEIIDFLVNQKRHQIKINPKSETDNTKTNLKSNSADYLKYLVDNNILSTNAVVNEPTFQGYTNIYLNTGITVNNQPKVESYDNPFNSKEQNVRIAKELNSESKNDEIYDLKSARKGDKGIYYTTFKGVRQDWETDKEVTIKAVSKLGVLFEGDSNWKNFNDHYHNFTNLTLQEKLNPKIQSKVSEQGVEVKTDNTGFGELFGDKPVATQLVTGLSITYTPTGKQSQTYTINKNKIINSKGEEVFKEDSTDRRKIFANVAIKEGRAKVIEDNKGVKYVVNNKQQIMSTATGKIMEWAENHATRKLLLDKYNKLVQPEISDSGVKVNANNTGFNELFENNSQTIRNSQENFVSLSEDNIIGQTIIASQPFNKGSITGEVASIKPNPIKKGSYSIILTNGEKVAWNKETNNFVWVASDNSKFTSLSEIPGTMENTELKETQAEVFNNKRTPKEKALDFRRMNVLFKKHSDGTLTSEKELRDFDMFKQMYPQEFEKKCK
jgi:hypothetical protein